MKDSLFGKYCYIDTPWIAGKKTVYRILASDTESNTYCEVPYSSNSKPVSHGNNFERIVYVVLDTLVDEDSKILRFALKDVEIIDDESKKVKHGKWIENSTGTSYKCSVCGCPVLYVFDMGLSYREYSDYCECLSNFCPHCGADMREGESK